VYVAIHFFPIHPVQVITLLILIANYPAELYVAVQLSPIHPVQVITLLIFVTVTVQRCT
jgi:hypothetical protein